VGAPVHLFDALGRLVLTAVLPSSGELDLSSLMPGLYSLRSPGTGFVQRIERR
jgi:hypothetical protein